MNSTLSQYVVSALLGTLYAVLFVRIFNRLESAAVIIAVFGGLWVPVSGLTMLLGKRVPSAWSHGLFVIGGIVVGGFMNAVIDDAIGGCYRICFAWNRYWPWTSGVFPVARYSTLTK